MSYVKREVRAGAKGILGRVLATETAASLGVTCGMALSWLALGENVVSVSSSKTQLRNT